MPRGQQVSIEELYRLLPDLEELEELRLGFVEAAVPDPERQWDGPSLSTTIDKRMLGHDAMRRALGEAEASFQQHISSVFARLGPLVDSLYTGRAMEAAAQLIALGGDFEARGRFGKARQCFEAALAAALPLTDKAPQIEALRRIGRMARALGDFDEALLHYRRSADLAQAVGDVHNHVIALTGVGNVLVVQGLWPRAEQAYREALDHVARAGEGAYLLERGQLYNNLGMVSIRQGRIEDAERWTREARRCWERIASPDDQAVCLHNLSMLRAEQGRLAEACGTLHDAMELPINATLSVIIALDLAELYLRQGLVSSAEQWGREAEQRAVRTRSPFYIADMYRGIGKIVWAMHDENAVTFFEKALEIARKKRYLVIEAQTLVDYAPLRAQTGQADEAQAYLERALQIFHELGAAHEVARVEAALRELGAEVAQPVG